MERTNKKQNGFIGWFKDNWAHNSLFSTIFALFVMIVIQSIVMGNIAGSFSGLFPKMRMAWLNILRNNTYAGLIEGEENMTEHNIMFLATGGLKHETENMA